MLKNKFFLLAIYSILVYTYILIYVSYISNNYSNRGDKMEQTSRKDYQVVFNGFKVTFQQIESDPSEWVTKDVNDLIHIFGALKLQPKHIGFLILNQEYISLELSMTDELFEQIKVSEHKGNRITYLSAYIDELKTDFDDVVITKLLNEINSLDSVIICEY